MKLFSFLLSVGVLLAFSGFSQNQELHFSVQESEISNGFVVKKIWLKNYEMPKIIFSETVFEEMKSLNLKFCSTSFKDVELILGKEKKKPFAFVRIPVYFKENKKLSSFSMIISEQESLENKSTPALKTTTDNSVLASGKWYKISVAQRGIFKLDYNFIQNKLGINPATISTTNIRVYGNGGTVFSENNSEENIDDLKENSIVVMDGGDGIFNQNDYVLFYANGPLKWIKDSVNKSFNHVQNIYNDSSYYFLNFDLGPGLRIANQTGNFNPNLTVNSFNNYATHDQDIVNVGRFGKTWWGEEFSNDPGKHATQNFNFQTSPLIDSALVRLHFGSRSSVSGNSVNALLNGQSFCSTSFGSVGNGIEDNPIVDYYQTSKLKITGNALSIQIQYNPAISTGKGYLDYLELNWRSELSFQNGQMNFCDWNSVGNGNIANYQMQNSSNNIVVWDITETPTRMNGNLSGSTYSFNQSASFLHEFVAFDGSSFFTPGFTGIVANQNLHASPQVDYIIVTHHDFLEAANKLANFHQQKNNYRVIVATTEQVFNEFGSGSQDIGAIRDFARMFYKRAGNDTAEMPKHILLLGDASFDYKNRTANNTNFVPTYETSESVDLINSYCSDDFFGFLDDNEGIENWSVANTLDMGVGRLPVTTEESAMSMVDKIINYSSVNSLGPWRLSTTLITDNGDGNQHFLDGEVMASTIENHSPLHNETKVYLSAIPTISTPGGVRAPDANKAINDAIFKGTFLMNYNGHGSISTMAHERIMTQDDFNYWKNFDKLPIMVTATCDFSKYDDPAYVSAGEKLVVKADGGAIALLTTTQLVYAFLNRPMNAQFLSTLFQNNKGDFPSFGEAFRNSKNITYTTLKDSYALGNYRKFVLLGDPASMPNFPKYNIETEALLDGNNQQPVDTIRALGKYQIKGNIKDNYGSVLSNFNGRLYITIFDKPKTVNTLDASPLSFQIQNSIIYKGKVSVSDGKFSFVFIAPKDLNYDFGKGKISYYAENGVIDAAGMDTNKFIGGFSESPVVDNNEPLVKPYMNDSLFHDGGITGNSSILFVKLFDETGINVSGNSIGHDLTAVLDDDYASPFILNDYYETAPNDYQTGFVHFPISGLIDGRHAIKVKAWDMNNNSGEGLINFEVLNGKIVAVQNLMNYPNPFSTLTHFVFDHNRPNEELTVNIKIVNTNGILVTNLTQTFTPEGSRSEITWDGTDSGIKLPSGLYVYEIILTTKEGIQTSAHEKLVIVR